jgi:isoaspartyl peptidase/L-asparaginase-like protein (Ntn-hydrolase superfamily)
MQPVLIASERGEMGLAAGMAVLRGGGSAMDAVEAAIRVVGANEDDHDRLPQHLLLVGAGAQHFADEGYRNLERRQA